MIPYGGYIPYTLEKHGLPKMLALEATNSLLRRHLLIFAQEIHYQEALWQILRSTNSAVSSDSLERQVLLTFH